MMRLANKMNGTNNAKTVEGDASDPRDAMSAEIIDFASRNSYPVVARKPGKSDKWSLAAGIGIVGLLGAVTLWSMDTARLVNETAPEQQAAAPAPRQTQVEAPVEAPAEQEKTTENQPAAALQQAASSQQTAIAAAPLGNPLASPTVVFDASALPSPADLAPAATGAASGNSASDFASRIGGVGGAPAQAAEMVNPSTTVTQGTLIPAILETAINTDVPGYVRAIVSSDVRSFDGTRILVPRSSRLIGQYQSGLQGGQKRAYVIWTRLIRTDGVSVALASPGTDFSGTAGLPGKVNSHFFKRFGSAMVLSVIGGLSTIASGGSSLVLGGGQSAASAAVSQDGQIGPTVRVRQGEPIRVFTARDLDFSRVNNL